MGALDKDQKTLIRDHLVPDTGAFVDRMRNDSFLNSSSSTPYKLAKKAKGPLEILVKFSQPLAKLLPSLALEYVAQFGPGGIGSINALPES